jgi:hypothetical protein
LVAYLDSTGVSELLSDAGSVGVHSTIAMLDSDYSPNAPAGSNNPGLESTNIFGMPSKGGNTMHKHGWLFWLAIAVAAFFAYQYFTTGTVTV